MHIFIFLFTWQTLVYNKVSITLWIKVTKQVRKEWMNLLEVLKTYSPWCRDVYKFGNVASRIDFLQIKGRILFHTILSVKPAL